MTTDWVIPALMIAAWLSGFMVGLWAGKRRIDARTTR